MKSPSKNTLMIYQQGTGKIQDELWQGFFEDSEDKKQTLAQKAKEQVERERLNSSKNTITSDQILEVPTAKYGTAMWKGNAQLWASRIDVTLKTETGYIFY
jgi:hypothetical protein